MTRFRRPPWLAWLILLASLFSAVCGGSTKSLTEGSLRNASYDLPGVGSIALRDGLYAQSSGPGATAVTRATLVAFALGELDGVDGGDAVVVIAWSGGGSGTFYDLVAVIQKNGTGRQAGVQQLGDRIKLNSLLIEKQAIEVKLVTQGPNDPLCCPTLEKKLTYRLKGNALELQ